MEDEHKETNSEGEEELQDIVDALVQLEGEIETIQESLEESSLEKLRAEVREELSITPPTGSSSDIESAVESELQSFIELSVERLRELNEERPPLQQAVEDAGVDLFRLYCSLEAQASNTSQTPAWTMAPRVGQTPSAAAEVLRKQASAELDKSSPVRDKRGAIIEKGASGYICKRFGGGTNEISLSSIPLYQAVTPADAERLGIKGAADIVEIGKVSEELDRNEMTSTQRRNLRRVGEEKDLRQIGSINRKARLRAIRSSSSNSTKRILKKRSRRASSVPQTAAAGRRDSASTAVDPNLHCHHSGLGFSVCGFCLPRFRLSCEPVGHCKWCQDTTASEVVQCEGCSESFCVSCIHTALGRNALRRTLVPADEGVLVEWSCVICARVSRQSADESATAPRNALPPKPSSPPHSSMVASSAGDFLSASTLNLNNTAGQSDDSSSISSIDPTLTDAAAFSDDISIQSLSDDEEYQVISGRALQQGTEHAGKQATPVVVERSTGIIGSDSCDGLKNTCQLVDFVSIGKEERSNSNSPDLQQKEPSIKDESSQKSLSGGEDTGTLPTPGQAGEARAPRSTRSDSGSSVAANGSTSDAFSSDGVDDPCRVCMSAEDPEKSLLCDGCDGCYHLSCLEPKLQSVPEGNWYCDACIRTGALSDDTKDSDFEDVIDISSMSESESNDTGAGISSDDGATACFESALEAGQIQCHQGKQKNSDKKATQHADKDSPNSKQKGEHQATNKKGTKSKAASQRQRTSSDSDVLVSSDDFEDTPCSVCGRNDDPNHSLLCDGCDSCYHLGCLDPQLSEIPAGEWFCPACEASRSLAGSAKRRNIKRIRNDSELNVDTKRVRREERERRSRLKKLEKAAKERQQDEEAGVAINYPREDSEDPIYVHEKMAKLLKPHQVDGIRFLWQNVICSVKQVLSSGESTDGLGCVLAHSMGLGKTLQVISFVHTLIRELRVRSKECKPPVRNPVSRVLVVCPVNVLHTWKHEFTKWLPRNSNPFLKTDPRIHLLDSSQKTTKSRLEVVRPWFKGGGVLLMGFDSYKNLSTGKRVKSTRHKEQLKTFLRDPGPDLIILDEGHLVKNPKSQLAIALQPIRTRRRVVLTGTPLQNNLVEYFSMINFVRPGFLGTLADYRNQFVTPITNGQASDSIPADVRLMKQRAHVLFNRVEGFVQRRTFQVLSLSLPAKNEYVLSIRLSQTQLRLYNGLFDASGGSSRQLFRMFHKLSQIWNHPYALYLAEKRARVVADAANKKQALRDWIVDDDCEVPTHENSPDATDKVPVKGSTLVGVSSTMGSGGGGGSGPSLEAGPTAPWWTGIIDDPSDLDPALSGKTVMLLRLLLLISLRDEKVLVFTQSVLTLDYLTKALAAAPSVYRKNDDSVVHAQGWKSGRDFLRLDGSVNSEERQKLIKKFHHPSKRRLRLFLLSTRAGCLGINLIAATRVIIFDASWNPSHDLQAIFRAYRYGQTRPVFVYRFIAHGTMEDKIYARQIAKQGLSARVVDEVEVTRFFSGKNLSELLSRVPPTEAAHAAPTTNVPAHVPSEAGESDTVVRTSAKEHLSEQASSVDASGTSVLDPVPVKGSCGSKSVGDLDDELLRELVSTSFGKQWLALVREHDSLLEEAEDEQLTEAEKEAAVAMYLQELERADRALNIKDTTPGPSAADPLSTLLSILAQHPPLPQLAQELAWLQNIGFFLITAKPQQENFHVFLVELSSFGLSLALYVPLSYPDEGPRFIPMPGPIDDQELNRRMTDEARRISTRTVMNVIQLWVHHAGAMQREQASMTQTTPAPVFL